jgi:hypothetical protein
LDTVTVIDGATLRATPLGVGSAPRAIAVNPATGRVTVVNEGSDDITIIDEYPAQAIPLVAAIGPLGGNNTATTSATFGIQGTSLFSPTAPTVRAVYYQLNSLTGPWQRATGSAPNFTASVSGLTLGTHTLYAFAGDGAEPDNAGYGNFAPGITSRIAAYSFTYSPFTLALTAVKSRKTHGANSIFDIPIQTGVLIGGAVSVEPRQIGSGHSVVFQFNGTVTLPGTLSVTDAQSNGIGSVSARASGNEVIVTLASIADNRRALVSLTNINGAGLNASAALGFLVGDITGSRSVNASDIAAIKARNGATANLNNFRADINLSGVIDGTDASAAKARSGLVIP